MNSPRKAPPPILSRTTTWTAERIGTLTAPEVKQLRANAERLQETEVAELCTQVLKTIPRTKPVLKPGAKKVVAKKPAAKPAVKVAA